MSDQANQVVEKPSEQVSEQQTEIKIEEKNEKVETLEAIKSFYKELITKKEKELMGTNRKVSELQNEVKKFKAKEMTSEEQQALKEKELKEEFAKLYRLKAINKFEFKLDEEDDIDFSDYLNGENEEEVLGRAEKLKIWIDKKIAKGIERGVEERISKGYVPKTGFQQPGKRDFSTISKEELGALYAKAYKEKNEEEKGLIKQEQMRRLKLAV
jgi:hypothetical protein